jgi:hypothetical protein
MTFSTPLSSTLIPWMRLQPLDSLVIPSAILKPVPMTVSAIFRALAAGIEFLWLLSDVLGKTAL